MSKRISTLLMAVMAAVVLTAGGCGSGAKVTTTVPSKADQPRQIVNQYAYSFYASAVLAEQEKDYTAALAYYSEALKQAPGNTDILYALADLEFRLRQPQRALETAQKIFYKDKNANMLIANCYRALGDHATAELTYAKVLRMDPHNLQAHWYSGVYASQRGDIDAAAMHFEEVAQLNPTPAIYVEIAKLHNSRHQVDDAIAAYRNSIELDPTESNMEAYLNLAGLLRANNDASGAEEILVHGIAANPESRAFRLYLAELYNDQNDTTSAIEIVEWIWANSEAQEPILERIGQIAFELDRLDLADSIFERQLTMSPESILSNFYRGRIAIIQDRNSDAKGFFWKLIDVADSLPDGYINLGMIYLDEDSLDLAVDILKDGVARAANGREEAQYYLATALGRAERYDEVLPIARALTKTHPEEIRFLFMLGSAYERTQMFDSATAAFTKILEMNPDHAQTLNYLGYMWADLGINLDESRRMIERALEIDGENGAYLDSYGWVLYRLGNYKDAEVQIRKAIALVANEDYILFDHLGDICHELGRFEEAKQSWKKALDIDPDNVEIQEKLTR
ncbi:MAG: tetratricopeptide repeat protein [candidate division Zixibacteria bacterium]|nr:tetratricopeptide repeat protein [candidate division Zixibacteria bacterium]MBU1469700.1 tetratricopeptide repeat protein [candidate division Zixibacteria bacterium]MBU2626090.1 tetratricopeptide repeat protein [candidate division Zixibacteria bacterium]